MIARPPVDRSHQIRRITHPGRLIGIAVVALALLAGAFIAGRFFQPAAQPSPSDMAQVLDVWATVEHRPVAQTASFAGITQPGVTRNVLVTAREPSVVLRQTTEPGRRVHPGDTAGVVSGQTFIFLPEPLALYRDLGISDRGDDVTALQEALTAAGHPTAADGVFGQRTAQAVRNLFHAAGSPLPVDQPVMAPYRQFVPLPAEGAVVASAAAYGSRLSSEQPLLTLQTSAPTVEFIADVTHVGALKTGQSVTVTSEAGTTAGQISRIGDFRAGLDGARSGHPVTVTFDVRSETAPPEGQTVTVDTAGTDRVEPVLAVPLTALRAEGSQAYVLVQITPSDDGGASGSERRVDVTVERTGGGYAAVVGEVDPGDRVKVS